MKLEVVWLALSTAGLAEAVDYITMECQAMWESQDSGEGVLLPYSRSCVFFATEFPVPADSPVQNCETTYEALVPNSVARMFYFPRTQGPNAADWEAVKQFAADQQRAFYLGVLHDGTQPVFYDREPLTPQAHGSAVADLAASGLTLTGSTGDCYVLKADLNEIARTDWSEPNYHLCQVYQPCPVFTSAKASAIAYSMDTREAGAVLSLSCPGAPDVQATCEYAGLLNGTQWAFPSGSAGDCEEPASTTTAAPGAGRPAVGRDFRGHLERGLVGIGGPTTDLGRLPAIICLRRCVMDTACWAVNMGCGC